MNNDVNELVKINTLLKHNKNMLYVLILKCMKRYIIKEDININFNLLALILNLNDLN